MSFKGFITNETEENKAKGYQGVEFFQNVNIEGYEHYLISTKGRVVNSKTNRLLKTRIDSYGYELAELFLNGKSKNFRVHRLIALTFIDGHEEGLVVNHLNGIKDDNHYFNLEWVTQKENVQHAWETGLYDGYVERVEQGIEEIGKLYTQGYSTETIANKTGLSMSYIQKLIKRNNFEEPKVRFKFPKDEFLLEKIDEVKKMLDEGYKIVTVANELSTDHKHIRKIMKAYGFKVNKDVEPITKREKPMDLGKCEQAIILIKYGYSEEEISEYFGCAWSTVEEYCRKLISKEELNKAKKERRKATERIRPQRNAVSRGQGTALSRATAR